MSWQTYISVASNLEPEQHIEAALKALAEAETISGLSTFYLTAPIGRPDQPQYFNGAVRLESLRPPRALKEEILRPIETQLGRVRSNDKFAARTIDLDILLAGNATWTEHGLNIPDPDLLTRPFLAAAVLDIDPALQLPGEETPLAARLSEHDRARLTPALAFSGRMKERFLP